MTVVRGHSGQPTRERLPIPLGEVVLGISQLGGEKLVRVEAQAGFQFVERFRVGQFEHQGEDSAFVLLGVGMPVVNLHTVEAGHRVVGALLDVREENQAPVVADGLDERRGGIVHTSHGRVHRVDQEPSRLRAGNEQNTVVEPSPGVRDEVFRRSMVVAQKDRAHTGLFRVGQHLRARSPRVRRVFGVGVEDHPIVVPTGPRRDFSTRTPELRHILMGGLEPGRLHSFDGRPRFGRLVSRRGSARERRQPDQSGEAR